MCVQIRPADVDRLVRPHRARLVEAEVDAIGFVLRQVSDVR
jgi:hypothetical protein